MDHLICSKCLFMTLLYNMYKPINFHSYLFSELRYMSNGLAFKILNGISRNYEGCCQIIIDNNGYKISWHFLENWLTGYQKANFYFGPSSTVGQTIVGVLFAPIQWFAPSAACFRTWYGSTSLQQSSKRSCSLHESGHNLRAYCQWLTLVPTFDNSANAATMEQRWNNFNPTLF